MGIFTTSSEVKITPQQAIQIAEFEHRLDVVVKEISINTKTLSGIKKNIEDDAKYNKFQQEEKERLTQEVATLETKKAEIVEEMRLKNEEAVEISRAAEAKKTELSTRETSVLENEKKQDAREKELGEKEAIHEQHTAKLADDRREVDRAKEVLQTAINSI